VNEGVVAIGIVDDCMYKEVGTNDGILPSSHRAIDMPCLTLISLSAGEVSSRDERIYQNTSELERKFNPGKP
jgi:hypothetical protein